MVDISATSIPDKGDAVDYIGDCGRLEDLPLREPPSPPALTTRLSDVVAESVSGSGYWYIPRAKVVLIEGDPGLGKSTAILDLVSRWTKNLPMPDGAMADLRRPMNTVLIGTEDGLADTVRPRLDAAGADTTRVHIVYA